MAFAILLLSIAGGIGGLYAHRQNQETTKKYLIEELQQEIADLREKTAGLRSEFDSRIGATQLKHAVSERKIPLVPIDPARRHQVTAEALAAPSPTIPAPVIVAGSP